MLRHLSFSNSIPKTTTDSSNQSYPFRWQLRVQQLVWSRPPNNYFLRIYNQRIGQQFVIISFLLNFENSIPMKRFGKFDKLFLIFSRRSNESVLLFSFRSEIDIAVDALSTVKAFATREMVSRSEKKHSTLFNECNSPTVDRFTHQKCRHIRLLPFSSSQILRFEYPV